MFTVSLLREDNFVGREDGIQNLAIPDRISHHRRQRRTEATASAPACLLDAPIGAVSQGHALRVSAEGTRRNASAE